MASNLAQVVGVRGMVESCFFVIWTNCRLRVQWLAGAHPGSIPSLSFTAALNRCLQPM